MADTGNPYNYVSYGPDANCTLAVCPIEASVYQYRPSLPVNSLFITIYGVIGIIQTLQLLRYRTWWFGGAMILGCISEMLGYGGRVLLYQNPFSFNGFLLQIICITFAPVFYTAAIYFTLAKIVIILDPSLSRFPPKYYYIIFISSDCIALALQAGGGASSSTSSGDSQAGVDAALAGLSFQVASLCLFIALATDYLIRYCRRSGNGFKNLTGPGKIFAIFVTTAIVLILARCSYRIAELHQGYSGYLIHDQPLFIALEGVLIIVASICLCIGHPGYVFGKAGDLSGGQLHNLEDKKIVDDSTPETSGSDEPPAHGTKIDTDVVGKEQV